MSVMRGAGLIVEAFRCRTKYTEVPTLPIAVHRDPCQDRKLPNNSPDARMGSMATVREEANVLGYPVPR
jgi:hypothetical protein